MPALGGCRGRRCDCSSWWLPSFRGRGGGGGPGRRGCRGCAHQRPKYLKLREIPSHPGEAHIHTYLTLSPCSSRHVSLPFLCSAPLYLHSPFSPSLSVRLRYYAFSSRIIFFCSLFFFFFVHSSRPMTSAVLSALDRNWAHFLHAPEKASQPPPLDRLAPPRRNPGRRKIFPPFPFYFLSPRFVRFFYFCSRPRPLSTASSSTLAGARSSAAVGVACPLGFPLFHQKLDRIGDGLYCSLIVSEGFSSN